MLNEFRAVIEELGGERTLGRRLSSDRDLREAIREGFRSAVVEKLMRASGLTLKELASALDLSPRSLQRRRSSGRLERHESDRLYRLARIVAIANVYLGDRSGHFAGLGIPIVRSPESPLWRKSTPNSVHARWRTSWAGLRMAESVRPSLSESEIPNSASSYSGQLTSKLLRE